MHTTRNRVIFYGGTLAAGLLSLGLHRYMMDNCFDAKGLLIAGNLPGRLLVLVGVVYAVGLLAAVRTIGGDGTWETCFPRDVVSGLMMTAAGVVLALSVPELAQVPPLAQNTVTPWTQLVGQLSQVCMKALPWLAAASMAALGVFRLLGRRAPFLPGGVICLFYMLMLVNDYRLWSADPQLQDYAYQLLAGVLLMLCSFHRACCDAGVIQRKKLIATALMAAFCAIAALSMDFQRGLYLASALWALGSVCSVAVLPPDPEEEAAPEETPQEEADEA